ncbi:uncharacterized protein Z520_05006 [Fonsecaea multimorphosa CBS 102226]|uniref:Uncharacterized protein n=1 Tax=Fonsecaea multimorphosa CBS 102226 TaxID=1442371 RepID=A0A0D2HC47_9EURO|nr:uncharacterized protein Z520_05006 [Fonsecaea multimorphosa CBS 102226]KIX99430.1 hypothetical protein Z520_05006 [Fonsecaea multimorphosa CBS 102226]
MGKRASSTTSSTDWTQLRFDTTPLDLRTFLQAHRESRVQSLIADVSAFAVIAVEYWEPDCYQDLLRSAPWLGGFMVENGDLNPACRALAVMPNLCTRLLLRLDAFKNLLGENSPCPHIDIDIEPSDLVEPLMAVMRYTRSSALGPLWREMLHDYSGFVCKTSTYQIFSTKVAEFCLEAGCPAVTRSPSEDIYSLRNHLFSTDLAAREAELRKEIEELRSANRSQQRIITNLAFRHLLEMLPPRDAKPGPSATAAWNAFFQHALKEAQMQLDRGEKGHPLIPIENVGTNLYSTLSTNIHHFSGQYKVLDDQWNALEVDILRAMAPLAENETEAGIDWKTERFRYGGGTSHE